MGGGKGEQGVGVGIPAAETTRGLGNLPHVGLLLMQVIFLVRRYRVCSSPPSNVTHVHLPSCAFTCILRVALLSLLPPSHMLVVSRLLRVPPLWVVVVHLHANILPLMVVHFLALQPSRALQGGCSDTLGHRLLI